MRTSFARLTLAFAPATLALLGTTGCVIEDGSGQLAETPMVVDIDEGATVALDHQSPGQGVAVMVEAQPGGLWRIKLDCDAKLTGIACPFDLYLAGINGTPANFTLQGGGEVSVSGPTSVADTGIHIFARTGTEMTGIDFQMAEGAQLELQALLDGGDARAYVNWNGDGVLQHTAPTNPIIFQPIASPVGSDPGDGG